MTKTPADIESRRLSLVQMGHAAALDASADLAERLNYACEFELIEKSITDINAAYFRVLKRFKKTNKFEDGERIAGPKIAALTMALVLTSGTKLFKSKNGVADITHFQYCNFTFCLYLIDTFVMADTIPNPKDLLATVGQIMSDKLTPSVVYTLCMYMHELSRHAKKPANIWVD